jgi:MbtH protein
VSTNPFEDEDASYLVLVNQEGQYSLWPAFADVPQGWETIFGREKRQACFEFIERNWTDMRPKSLIAQMEADSGREYRSTIYPHSTPAGYPLESPER